MAAERDPVMDSLDRLIQALRSAESNMTTALKRAETLRDRRRAGKTYTDAVTEEDRPLIVEVMREVVSDLGDAASRFQRAEARALWEEGVTMDRIAHMFGISRQRVSDLLGSPGRRARPTDGATP